MAPAGRAALSANVLSLTDVRKAFGEKVVLGGVTFGVDAGAKVGVIGANGSGKSTLMRIIAGQIAPDDGTVARRGGVKVSFLEQVPELRAGATAREVIAEPLAPLREAIAKYEAAAAAMSDDAEELLVAIERLGGWDWEHRVERAASHAGVGELDVVVDRMSGGERKRVALARLLLEGADLVLMDEPTNHLDAETVEWLETWIAESEAACLVITHDRYFLESAVETMAELRDGQLRMYPGTFTDYLEARTEEEEHRARTHKRRLQVLKAELEWARRSPKARTTKSKSRLKQIRREKDTVERLIDRSETADIRFQPPPRLGKTVLELQHVSKGFGGPPLIDDLTFIMRRGERYGVVGPNGSGKTTLLRMIVGEEEPDAGRIVLGSNTEIAYFDQLRSALDPAASVRETITPDGGDSVFPGGGDKVHAISWLERFAFPADMHGQKVGALSGGERNRLAICRFLLQPANLLLLDEPTNDLDLMTLAVLEDALLRFPGCVITVTHDRYFLDRTSTAILAFERELATPGRVTLVQGDYTHYRNVRLSQLQERKAAQAREAEARRAPDKAAAPAPKKKKALTYGEEKELEGLEPAIEAAEGEVARLEAALADPAVWESGHEKGAALQTELDAAKAESERLMARWEELMLRLEGE